MRLNDQQQRVVDHGHGPLLVLACPGSGKTRCITERIISTIRKGASPSSILAVTFTNKAASEMKERVTAKGGYGVMICTFHSLGVKILRKCGMLLGYKRNFTICDSAAQSALYRRIVKSQGKDTKEPKYHHKRLIGILEDKKNQLMSDEAFEFNLEPDMIEIFQEYQTTLRMSNSMDFGDLIYNVVRILEQNPKIQKFYSSKYKHILVDEMQDTNRAQLEMVRRLSSVHNNIIVVGDSDQCFPKDTLIQTPSGPKPIVDINAGDEVLTLIRPGIIGKSTVESQKGSYRNTLMTKLVFDDGTELNSTHNHLIPMSVDIRSPYFIYLMYKRGIGFRIGQCRSSRQGSYRGRLAQEHGDAIWVIDLAEDKCDSLIKEQRWSLKYGIPTTVFHTIGRKILYEDAQIAWLHKQLNSEKAGKMLLSDLGYLLDIPHHYPRMGAMTRDRYTINVSLCADRGLHRYSICSNNKSLLEKIGCPRKSRFKNWRIESSTKKMAVIDGFIRKAFSVTPNLNVYLSIKGDDKKPLQCQPAANAFPGTIVYGRDPSGNIVRKKVVSVENSKTSGLVYDLNISVTHNYFAGDTLVHNSIYGWRGACLDNIMKFERHFEGAEVVLLGKNYRSTPQILEVAEKLINKNKNRREIKLEAVRNSGDSVHVIDTISPEEEAEEISGIIQSHEYNGVSYKDMAILCRTNAITRSFEECFRRRRIPYVLIGAFGFYDRKEVKTAINFMKFIANSEDALAFQEIINVPSRGVGPATVIKILEHADKNDLPFLDVCRNIGDVKKVTSKCRKAISHFIGVIDNYDPKNPLRTLSDIFEDCGFLEHLRYTDQLKHEHREDNIHELLRAFGHYCNRKASPTMDQYLQEVMLLSSADKEVEEEAVSLMTCHAAKGLEFKIVFIPGMEEHTFPHKRSIAEGNLEEERRVCYVAVTRCRDSLYLSWSKLRGEQIGPSRFLEDMGLIDGIDFC